MVYAPPFTLSPESEDCIAEIEDSVSVLESHPLDPGELRLSRLRSALASAAIEGNHLTFDQAVDVIEGRDVSRPRREVLEVRNAFRCYEHLLDFDQNSIGDILMVHGMMMDGIIPDSGYFRSVEVGVYSGGVPVHIAPPARLVGPLMHDLMGWARATDVHPLVKGCVFHYEFEMIHPFVDGNGRTGRLWQNLILASWNGAMEGVETDVGILRNQSRYYSAIEESTDEADSGPFLEFMLRMIRDAVRARLGSE